MTKGNNDLGVLLPPTPAAGGRSAAAARRPGYDVATGWGSLKVSGLARAAWRVAAR